MTRTHEYQIISDTAPTIGKQACNAGGRGLATYSYEHCNSKYCGASFIVLEETDSIPTQNNFLDDSVG